MTQYIYKIWDRRDEKYITAGAANRGSWTRQGNAQRHVDELNKWTPGRYSVHRYALVRSEL